ncbi:hypothetical protein AB0B28_05815 [Glycomyces sp. NPDC046736]|uniref:hypothetical protein n=1 Tax=Glycomyces sp. NPDC046736 TaxID=3155615 RepID=UPI0033CB0227
MSGTHRAAQPHSQPAPRRRPEDADDPAPVPHVPAEIYGPAGPVEPQAETGEVPEWDPADHPVAPGPRSPLGTQTEGMAAIRAVWERAAETDRHRPARPGRPQRRREPKRLAPALLGVLVCACVLMFLAWSAAPALWLTVGHGQSGTVTVTSCATGFAPSCEGTFTGGGWSKDLAITGDVDSSDVGATLPARATGPGAHNAYVGDTAGLLLRWAPSLVLFMAAAFALVAVSGATRLYEGRSAAIGLCWAAAGAVLAFALAFAW